MTVEISYITRSNRGLSKYFLVQNAKQLQRGCELIKTAKRKSVTPVLLKVCAVERDLYNLFKCNFGVK